MQRPRRLCAAALGGHHLSVGTEHADANLRLVAAQRPRSVEGCSEDLVPRARGHEGGAGRAEHSLALHRALLLAVQPGHARDHESEQQHRCLHHYQHVDAPVPELVQDLHARCDQ